MQEIGDFKAKRLSCYVAPLDTSPEFSFFLNYGDVHVVELKIRFIFHF